MNIQIFGRKKCFDTKKAERFFKERKVKYQFIDINEKPMSKGEMNNILRCIDTNELINIKSKEYTKLNLDKIRSKEMKSELLLKNQGLMNTPVVRNGKEATVGFREDIWKIWIDENK